MRAFIFRLAKDHPEFLIDDIPAELTCLDPADAEIIVMSLKAGKKIEAIKHFRKSTGGDLRESKNIIDRIAQMPEYQPDPKPEPEEETEVPF